MRVHDKTCPSATNGAARHMAPARGSVLYVVLFLGLLALTAFFCFYDLGAGVVWDSDESRHAVNAYEMLRSGNLIANSYGGDLDYWNLKLPLSFWLIMGFYRLLGFTTFAFRCYSALAYVLTMLVLGLFVRHRFGRTAALCSMALGLTCSHLFGFHMVRSGDADSVFVLLTTCSLVCMLLSDEGTRWTCLSGLSFSLAFLEKSWHAGIIPAVVLVWLLTTRRWRALRPRDVLGYLGCCLAPIAIWAIARYSFDGTTFFESMVSYDLLSRSTTALEGNSGNFLTYAAIMLRDPGFLASAALASLLLVGTLIRRIRAHVRHAAPTSTGGEPDALTVWGLFLWFAVPFLLFSIASTKLVWYVYPTVIALFALGGIEAARIMHAIRERMGARRIIPALMLTAVCAVAGLGLYQTYRIVVYDELPASWGYSLEDRSYQEALQGVLEDSFESGSLAQGMDLYYEDASSSSLERGQTTKGLAQGTLAIAELYGDVTAEQSGISGFLGDDEAMIILPTDYYDEVSDRLTDATEVVEGAGYVILTH
ncbi:MAG: glycosyltransferase family 39 protein [Atopobiaceae bacterium]|nr:glycosyltransferase family 39 protein [Atopobiaceae bacterium]MDD3485486.1 glycosyltransferase family 39 protein [Atopobiaceae bacterium]